MSKYKDYLMKKYGEPEAPSRFKTAEIMMREREEFNEKIRKKLERRNANSEKIRQQAANFNRGRDPDDYWLPVELSDGRTILYKDGKQYDIDTGEEVFIIW